MVVVEAHLGVSMTGSQQHSFADMVSASPQPIPEVIVSFRASSSVDGAAHILTYEELLFLLEWSWLGYVEEMLMAVSHKVLS